MPATTDVSAASIAASRAVIADAVARTPLLRPVSLADAVGTPVAVKAESLQHAGSFKVRGVVAKLARMEAERKQGVVTGSAGNHGQALAYVARRYGVPCELFVPHDAPVSKIEPALQLGARAHYCEGTVDRCAELARERAEEAGLLFVHPFDDPDVIRGQGSVGLELIEEAPDLSRVLVPVGGGGLASGVAIAIKSELPNVEVVGVQVDSCPAVLRSIERGEASSVDASPTIADGIAVKRPGGLTLPIVERWLDGVVVVSDDEIADAMSALLAEAKLVVEGAGAVGLAALMSGRVTPAKSGTTAVILSGGNVDEHVLIAIARRRETAHGRGVVLYTTISDRPGSLADLLRAVARTGASVIEVRHLRDAVDLPIEGTGVELILETRGRDHTHRMLSQLEEGGYSVQIQHANRREQRDGA